MRTANLACTLATLAAIGIWYWLLLHPQGRLDRLDVPPAPVTQVDYDQAHAQMRAWGLPVPPHHR